MDQNITTSSAELVAKANAAVRMLTVDEARDMHGRDDVVFIDLRDIRELAKTGRISGARHVPRGMLEFWIDPESTYHNSLFAEDGTIVFYCASGWHSALTAKAAQDMGLAPVAHMDGGIGERRHRSAERLKPTAQLAARLSVGRFGSPISCAAASLLEK
jgi:rhodanese-related sulfurtransferase